MAVITKSQLADHLGITRGRVSQYLKMGLPVRTDGRVDLSAALNWIKSNVDVSYRGGGAAEAVAKTGRDEENPVDAAARLVIGLLFAAIPNIAAGAAREAGVSPKVAEEIAAIAHRRAVDSGNGINELFGLGDRDWPGLEMCRDFGKEV